MKGDEENLIYSYMLLAGAGAIVASFVFCLVVYGNEGLSRFMF